jgi:hypothetical protein
LIGGCDIRVADLRSLTIQDFSMGQSLGGGRSDSNARYDEPIYQQIESESHFISFFDLPFSEPLPSQKVLPWLQPPELHAAHRNRLGVMRDAVGQSRPKGEVNQHFLAQLGAARQTQKQRRPDARRLAGTAQWTSAVMRRNERNART